MRNGSMNIYASLDEARAEIQKRWNNKELKKKVEEYLGKIPEFFCDEPKAILFRNIITPDHELFHFLDLAKAIDLNPVGLEYTNDKFCTRNADKLCLGKMAFFQKRDKNGAVVIQYKKIIDLMKSDNQKFSDIKTYTGEGLVDFHHRLLRQCTGEKIEMYDMSEWIIENGGQARKYYEKVLAFFICYGVLFESFVTDDSEAEFERTVTLPAIEKVHKLFGVKPLIVRLLPDIDNKYWWCYPGEVERELIA